MRGFYDRLTGAGVKVYEYPGMTHAKVAVRDGSWSTIGSANLDALSMNHIYEFNYQSHDPRLAGQISQMTSTDLERSRQVKSGELGFAARLLGRLINKSPVRRIL
jgi:cardiolipin synthase A/B